MGLIETAILGCGLAMDAAAAAMADSMIYRRIPGSKLLILPLLFGLFQGLMPLLGFYAGSVFAGVITKSADFWSFLFWYLSGQT